MNYEEEKHGVVYFDPHRGFIEIRERYFSLERALRDNPYKKLKTGHFIACLGDAKNNIPLSEITPMQLKELVNIEEVGLKNIPQAYQEEDGSWWCRINRVCPTLSLTGDFDIYEDGH